jgi:hypothetical protein
MAGSPLALVHLLLSALVSRILLDLPQVLAIFWPSGLERCSHPARLALLVARRRLVLSYRISGP